MSEPESRYPGFQPIAVVPALSDWDVVIVKPAFMHAPLHRPDVMTPLFRQLNDSWLLARLSLNWEKREIATECGYFDLRSADRVGAGSRWLNVRSLQA